MPEQPTYDELKQKIRELEAIVSQNKNEQKILQDSEKKYRDLFENMLHEVHIWKLVHDEHGAIKTWKLVDANPAALKAWGKTLPAVIGKTTEEIFTGTDPVELFMPIVKKIFSEGKPYTWETYFPATGQTLYMVSIPCEDFFISTGVDVSKIKKSEKDMEETVLKLTEAIKAGNVGLWDWNLITNSVDYSKEWKKQIGYDESEISDDFEEWKKRIHPDDSERTLRHIDSCIGQALENHEIEFRLQHKDGSYRTILAHSSVIQDGDGKPVRMLGSHIDITDRKQL
ncbi:MAG TPA: PAS domain-containing protein, partial [Pontiella sp.]